MIGFQAQSCSCWTRFARVASNSSTCLRSSRTPVALSPLLPYQESWTSKKAEQKTASHGGSVHLNGSVNFCRRSRTTVALQHRTLILANNCDMSHLHPFAARESWCERTANIIFSSSRMSLGQKWRPLLVELYDCKTMGHLRLNYISRRVGPSAWANCVYLSHAGSVNAIPCA